MSFVCLTVDVEQDCPPYLNTFRGIEEGMQKLLSLFAEEKIHGTFFTTGMIAEKYPKLMEKIVEDEHELGCHGYSHQRFDQINFEQAKIEIEKATQILRKFYPVISFRAPNLQFPVEYLALLEAEKYQLDSSEGKHKSAYYKNRNYKTPLKRIPASVTSSVLRIPKLIRETIFRLIKNPIVLFVHPWEFVNLRKEKLRLDCRFKTGNIALNCLRDNIHFFKRRNATFSTMKDLVESID